jgi:hypothetical protein
MILYSTGSMFSHFIDRILPVFLGGLSLGISLGAAERKVKPSDPVAGREHWAFQPLSRELPSSKSDWALSPIDRFVADRLESAKLAPVVDAQPHELARRLYVQLTGLPPNPEEVRSFVNDPSADSIARLVDGLLASPEYGARWGRHWLDLARYADSNGLDENFLFREAWRYRNWVVDSVNSDLSYDRFLLEQIAGDKLPYESIDQRDRQRIAAGFMVIGPKVLLGINTDLQKMDVADEQLDTIGRAVLGMTIGCARCHDHKFDPIPTADYYAMAGILTSTQVMERRHMLGEQRLMERLVGLGETGSDLDDAYEKYWRDLPELKKKLKRAEAALAIFEEGDLSRLEELIAKNNDSVSEDARETTVSVASRIDIQKEYVARLRSAIANSPKIPARAMVPADVESPVDEAIRRSGQFNRKGDMVPRGFLRVVNSGAPTKFDERDSGRFALGHWLTDEIDGAGNLAARVMVNRIWFHLMGEGLVRTLDNFGRTGETPSHPKLLDYLARRLVESEWSIKSLVREITLSRTFRLSTEHAELGFETDPDNRLYWRAHRRRLEPEVLRDAMLSVAGELDLNPMDSSVWYLGDQATAVGANKNRRRTDFSVRSLYLPMIRNDLPELFEAFDFADPHAATGARPRTMAPAQGLFMLNDEMVLELSEKTVRRVCDGISSTEGRLNALFETVFNCLPRESEKSEFLRFIETTERRLEAEGEPDPNHRVFSLVCQTMFSMSRFQFIE